MRMMTRLDILPSGVNLTSNEEEKLLRSVVNFLGHRRRNKYAFPLLIALYSFIFATGLFGNFCKSTEHLPPERHAVHCPFSSSVSISGTCVTIWRSREMHTPTNFYLFSLAVSDLLLIGLGKSSLHHFLLIRSACPSCPVIDDQRHPLISSTPSICF